MSTTREFFTTPNGTLISLDDVVLVTQWTNPSGNTNPATMFGIQVTFLGGAAQHFIGSEGRAVLKEIEERFGANIEALDKRIPVNAA